MHNISKCNAVSRVRLLGRSQRQDPLAFTGRSEEVRRLMSLADDIS